MNITQEQLKISIREIATDLGVRVPQVQNLLCQERFIARIATLPEGDKFVWKGGSLILRAYRYLPKPRYTIDIDLMLMGQSLTDVPKLIHNAMNIDLDDGLKFISLTHTPMKRDLPYGGDRYEIKWTLFGKPGVQALRIDISAGDVVEPVVVKSDDIFLLPKISETVSLKVYPKEFILAEKLETLANFKTGSTRSKDLIDVWTLFKSGIDPQYAKKAIEDCFRRRKTSLDVEALKTILDNEIFQQAMEQQIKKKFATLSLPPLKKMFEEISTTLTTILE